MRDHRTRWGVAAVLVLGVLTACASSARSGGAPTSPAPATETAPAPTPVVTLVPASTLAARSGVRVTATIGPTCAGPVRPDQVCTQPYAGEFVVTDQSGREIARFVTDEQGEAAIDLPPGEYLLIPKFDPSMRLTATARQVIVPADGYAVVTFDLDTGIR